MAFCSGSSRCSGISRCGSEQALLSKLMHRVNVIGIALSTALALSDTLTDADAVLCSHLLNACAPDSIDARAINALPVDGTRLPHKQALENASLCLNAAKAQGCTVSHVEPADIVNGQVCVDFLHAAKRLLCAICHAQLVQSTAMASAPCAWRLGTNGNSCSSQLHSCP